MAGTERAVIYVESASDLTGLSKNKSMSNTSGGPSSRHHSHSHSLNHTTLPKQLQDKNNYVIKIQIGEESMYNPVRIDVSSAAGKNGGGNRGGLGKSTLKGEDSPLNSSGQSSPRSDLTPPPRINAGVIRFGSETSESDTESDVSAEYRPVTCPTAQFAMREMLEIEPMMRPIISKSSIKNSSINTKGSSLSKSISYVSSPRQEIPLKAHFKEFRNDEDETDNFEDGFGRGHAHGSGNGHGLALAQLKKKNLSHCQLSLPNNMTSSNGIDIDGIGNGSVSSNNNHYSYGARKSNSSSNNNKNVINSEDCMESIKMGLLKTSLRMSRFLKDQEEAASLNFGHGRDAVIDENGFHLNEISDCNAKVVNENKEVAVSNFAGYKDIFSRAKPDGPNQIMSEKGTIRGVKNRVRDGIATFLQSNDIKTYSDKEQGRVVVYVTSMGVVRDTFQRCHKVKQILRTLLVKFDERDCYMNKSIQCEIRQRLPRVGSNVQDSSQVKGSNNNNNNSNNDNNNLTSLSPIGSKNSFDHISLPQVFLEGQHLGDAEAIEKLNETGELRDLLRPYKSLSVLSTCDQCGGFRMLPCPICNGSKKSVHRNHFTTEFVALKCMHCDPSGLVNCDLCNKSDS